MFITKRDVATVKPVIIAIFLFASITFGGWLYLQMQRSAEAADMSKFDPSNIMSDIVMGNKGSMTEAQIQTFLESKNPCNNTNISKASQYHKVKDGRFVCMYEDTFDGETAAHIIWQAAQDYSINPQVIIVLLQKEQGLITDTWPNSIQYNKATGYGCPDTAACDTQYYGLKNQIRQAANLFRNVLNGGWTNYPVGNNYVQYNPNTACGGTTINIKNRATSALYRYTPYQPNQSALNAGYGSGDSCGAYGNRNFWLYFTDWFGSTQGDYCTTSLTQTNTGVLFGKVTNKYDQGVFTIYSGSSTGCVESHVWNQGLGSWQSHTSTISSSINTADSMITYADLDGDGKDEGILVGMRNTGSGKIEFHVWDSTQKKWKAHYISNSSTMNPELSQISFADLDGDGKDEGILIGMANGSTSTGKIEMHVWNQGFGTWKSHIISNQTVSK